MPGDEDVSPTSPQRKCSALTPPSPPALATYVARGPRAPDPDTPSSAALALAAGASSSTHTPSRRSTLHALVPTMLPALLAAPLLARSGRADTSQCGLLSKAP